MSDEPVEPVIEAPRAEPRPKRRPSSPALTIVIQSWATPIAALLMLLIGLGCGYLAYPVIARSQAAPTQASAAVDSGSSAPSASNPELMDAVIEQTIHYIGDENAPVTIVEFSDYQ